MDLQAQKAIINEQFKQIKDIDLINAIKNMLDAAKKIADAFRMSLDYLVGEGINPPFNQQTLKGLQEIQDMKPDFNVHLFSIIDPVTRDFKTQQTYIP